jgi:hypothetical protein
MPTSHVPSSAAALAISTLSLFAFGAVSPPVAAAAATPLAVRPTVTIVIESPADILREDRLTGVRVVATGVDKKTKIRVNWGNGSATQVKSGRCSSKTAATNPGSCVVTFEPLSYGPGQYTITAASGTTRASKSLTVVAQPVAWSPPGGWTQPAGWSLLSRGATFTPCQKVDWYFDRTGETADRVTMIDDIRAGLAFITPETGLAFTETASPADADLTFMWGNLNSYGGDVAGWGRIDGPGEGTVALSNTVDWTLDRWAGRGVVRYDLPDRPGWYQTRIGRQTLVIHEVMHTLGMGHVNDITSIMYPQGVGNANAGILNPSDREALRTMYLNNPCPAIPD